MINLRRADDRFHTRIGWLDSRHTFSFADHYDPRHMGFRALRVINDDVVQPANGFGTHPHRDMEILTVVLDGGSVSFDPDPARHAWVQVARGKVKLNGQELADGDGAAVSGERSLKLEGDGEVLLFDLA